MPQQELIQDFSKFYHAQSAPWTKTFWLGLNVAKCPLDLWVYQEIIAETRPDVLLETGTSAGGSALFFASVMDMIGHGRVVTVDKDYYPHLWRQHPRITYLVGDSVSAEVLSRMESEARGCWTMVSLDSLHTYEHVSKELTLYSKLVSPGCYLVCEDTNVDEEWGKPAALAAVQGFLAASKGAFAVDASREKHLLTFNPNGWLRRVG